MTEHSPAESTDPDGSQGTTKPMFWLPEPKDVTGSQDGDTADVSQGRDLPGGQPVSAGQRPRWGIKQAAQECGVSVRTVTRRISDLQAHGAFKDEEGHWLIPVEALQAVGFQPGRPTPPEAVSHGHGDRAEGVAAGHDSPGLGTVVLPVEDLIDLREQVATLKGERDAAKARAEGLEVALSATQTALRVLEAAPPAVWQQSTGHGEVVERRWWGGKKKQQ